MRTLLALWTAFGLCGSLPARGPGEPLPFNHKVEVFREKDSDQVVFCLRLEQPFLAEEFEKSNYLRLQAVDRNAYLIYPKETKFQQKHAEFYGRLRGQGKAKLRLSYETVTENLDGSRRVDVRHGDVEIPIPATAEGPKGIFQEWARQQNAHFLNLLQYYPDETFFQYVLLQSPDRYGIPAPVLGKPDPDKATVETNLYDVFTGSLAVQEMLQHQTLTGGTAKGDQSIHISELTPPRLQSLDYARLLEEKRSRDKIEPKPHAISGLIPQDQYFLHFNSLRSAGELLDLGIHWGDNLLRLLTVQARDNRVQDKLEDQLCLRRDPLTRLFADGVVSEFALTGSDPFFLEGTDLTFVFRLKKPELFHKAAEGWLAQVKKKFPEVSEREFNYRGHRVLARYTNDRVVSSFVVSHEDYVVFSNSHNAIRKVVDAALGKLPRLSDAPDYRYMTTLLPPSADANSGYLFGSEAFVKRLVGPEAKIAERRRVQCFNNLVMLNNASLFYRMEHGKSPGSLSDLVQGRFVDPSKVVCSHGGAYAFDPKHDTCTCSLHNRLKYLTPNAELPVLKVATHEREEYDRYKTRYQTFWQTVFDPIAVRITVVPRVKLEVCVLPFANGSLYSNLRSMVDDKPQAIETHRLAPSAVMSLMAVRGRKNNAELLRSIPGIPEALRADPTLTDLNWVGDRAALHLCDHETVLEIDPTRLREFTLPFGKITFMQQATAAAALAATKMPAYITLDVEDKEKAARLLEQLASRIFLEKGNFFGLATSLDAYRLPDYQKHACYALTYQIHALKIRMHIALVGNQLVAATRPEVLRKVIDAFAAKRDSSSVHAHMLLRLNRRALSRLQGDLQLYWEEKARLACHRNAISIYNLLKLYEVPVEDVPKLVEAKYGVRYFCPDHGNYAWDNRRDQVECALHGNRQRSKQNLRLDQRSSFAAFLEELDEVTASLRFQSDALFATVEIARRQRAERKE